MNPERHIDEAIRLHHAGRFDEATLLYRRILDVDPQHPGALSGLGMIEYHEGRFDNAIELLERVVEVTGEHPGFLMNLGAVHDGAGHPGPAARCYARAIAAAPTYPDPYYNLGALHLRGGRPGAAVEVFDQCMAATGRDFHALAYKAHALMDAGRAEEARYLLDHDRYVRLYDFDPPTGYRDLDVFSLALARHVSGHPSLRANVMSTVKGRHTGELMVERTGPVAAVTPRIHAAVHRYLAELADDPAHPVRRWAPQHWKLTAWGVAMTDGGHERSHIHPNGWISGVIYAALPDPVLATGGGHDGWLRFGEPTPELPVRTPPTLRDYQPGYGRIILFPSYFYHGTVPFRSATPRVCVSFDVEPLYG